MRKVRGVAGGVGLTRIGFNSRYFDFLPPSTESAQAIDILEADPLMSPVYANVTAPDIAAAQAMTTKLRALPEVGGVQTATDMLPVLGFTDDAAVLATAIRMVSSHITPEHREAAHAALTRGLDNESA